MYRIVFLDGKVYVEHRSTMTFEPKLTILRWYLGESRYADPDLNGKEVTWHNGVISCRVSALSAFQHYLSGSTVADIVESIDIPPPKTKAETRWNNGRWEKLLKTKGWVCA